MHSFVIQRQEVESTSILYIVDYFAVSHSAKIEKEIFNTIDSRNADVMSYGFINIILLRSLMR
ncbi:hypothetical protein SLEP1_g1771 [Rubroshorea leprosula]|uniref:Uncharacterized protein n=1 Tax=Rubroshorea leprosula TaxID=152421 RepID=A0AAV5HEU1_9ROSI|nr:hypothetical protein SLEP1_g1771 [Rubroshorea leprosula]